MKRSVAITGLGSVTALGLGAEPLWEGLSSGRSGLAPITRFDASGFPCHLGGEAKDASGSANGFSARDYVPKHYRKAVKVMARDVELAVAAAKFAVDDAGLETRGSRPDASAEGEGPTSYPSERMSCHIGAGFIAAETEELSMAMATSVDEGVFSLRRWGTGPGGGNGMNNLQPLWMLKYLPNMLACHVTIIHGLEGPSNTLLNGEASGLLSLGESLRVMQRGAADLGVAGSAESKLNFMGLVRMNVSGRIAAAPGATDAREVVRPFSPQSRGGLIGEAGGIVVIEDEGAARARGASVYARVIGFGAAHAALPTLPEGLMGTTWDRASNPTAKGLENAIRAALRDAGIDPLNIAAGRIDAVLPQGSGVGFIDRAEAVALRAVFGPQAQTLPIVCLAPFIGDCAAGNGGVQAVVGALCMERGQLPSGATCRLDGSRFVPGSLEGGGGVRRILLCSTGVSGQNAAVVLEAV